SLMIKKLMIKQNLLFKPIRPVILKMFIVFFFQAGDGIRDRNVTGVQTCALPIYKRDFLLKNGLYIAIVIIFIALCAITPAVKGVQLLTLNNVLNILQQASPRMFLALGVAGLILLAGTDLSIGRMVGMGMVTATIIMHQGI